MKKLLKTSALSAFCLAAGFQSHAVTTNWVAAVNLSMTIYAEQKPVTNNGVAMTKIFQRQIVTKDIIGKLGQFSSSAKLIIKVRPKSDGEPVFYVRDVVNRTNVVDTDVSGKIQANGSDSIKAAVVNLNTGAKSSTEYMILGLHFDDRNGTSFEAGGFGTLRQSSQKDKTAGDVGEVVRSLTAKIAGSGRDTADQFPTSDFLLSGSLTITGLKLEIK